MLKILFTADLHSNEEAFRQFVRILDTDDYDCGVIAGDLTEDNVTKEEAIELLGITEDDLLPELSSVEETSVEALERQLRDMYKRTSYYMQVLRIKEQQLKEILTGTKKPIFIVKGNHDKTEWQSYKNVQNIHWKRVRFKGYSFVGYHYTEWNRTTEEMDRDFCKMKPQIGPRTILVTHIPAKNMFENYGDGLGNSILSSIVESEDVALHLFGHIHCRFGWSGKSVDGAYPTKKLFVSIDVKNHKISAVPSFTMETMNTGV